MTTAFTSFYLGDWHVSPVTNELSKDGNTIKIEAKVMDVLLFLSEHPDQLITREQLEQAVWKNTVVGYDALTGCIAKLRKTLGDSTQQPAYIETIPKKGYRLIATIKTDTTNGIQFTSPRPSSKISLTTLVIYLVLIISGIYALSSSTTKEQTENFPATIADMPSIVVLPFKNIGSDSGKDYFSTGMTADITTALSKLSGLMVIAPASVQNVLSNNENYNHIANSLGVRYVLEGSVRHDDKYLRINISLIDASSNIYLWSEKYDRQLNSLFDVQDEITAQIINKLSIKLTQQEQRRTALRYTSNFEAYDDFLKARALYAHHTQEDNILARELYQQAILRDEKFARAYSSLALTYIAEHRYGWNTTSEDLLEKALQIATQGVALNNELPQAYWTLAYVYLFRHEYELAANAARHSIELEPNYADSYISLAVSKMHSGSAEEALNLVKKAMLLNPKFPAAYSSVLGQIYYFMGKYELAEAALNEAIERNNNLLTPHIFLTVVLLELNRTEEASWSATQIKTINTEFNLEKIDELLPLFNEEAIRKIKLYLQESGLH